MPLFRQVLCAALAATLCLASSSAEARFGKRSQPKQERPSVHPATPVGDEDDTDEADDGCCHEPSRTSYRPVESGLELFLKILLLARPAPSGYASSVHVHPDGMMHVIPLKVRLGLEGQALGDGAALAFNLGVEGLRLGVDLRTSSLLLPVDDGTSGHDRLQLLGLHLTAAMIASERGRLRVEGGLGVARAPHLTFVGPSIGFSTEVCLVGALDLEGRVHLVPYPHRQLDAQGGLALHLGALSLRAGWRGLFLDDAGRVDGVRHWEAMGGPYVGLGLTF